MTAADSDGGTPESQHRQKDKVEKSRSEHRHKIQCLFKSVAKILERRAKTWLPGYIAFAVDELKYSPSLSLQRIFQSMRYPRASLAKGMTTPCPQMWFLGSLFCHHILIDDCDLALFEMMVWKFSLVTIDFLSQSSELSTGRMGKHDWVDDEILVLLVGCTRFLRNLKVGRRVVA